MPCPWSPSASSWTTVRTSKFFCAACSFCTAALSEPPKSSVSCARAGNASSSGARTLALHFGTETWRCRKRVLAATMPSQAEEKTCQNQRDLLHRTLPQLAAAGASDAERSDKRAVSHVRMRRLEEAWFTRTLQHQKLRVGAADRAFLNANAGDL